MAEARPAAGLVVRYRPEALATARSIVLPAARRRALLTLAVAAGSAVAIAVPTLATAGSDAGSGRLVILVALALPAWLAVVAVRRLRRPPVLPDVAFTVTDEHVVFAPRESAGLVPRRTAAERWDLATTTARVATGDGPGRLEITTTGGTPRTRAFPVDHLDTPPARILQALRRA